MKKLLLTTMAALAILFAQAQTPCDSITISGSQYQLTLTSLSTIDFWETTASDGTVLAQDSLCNMHSVYNSNPVGIPYDTVITCLYTMNMTCCVTYVWNGSVWTVPGGTPTPSWDCPTNSPGGCYDPGTGLGQYATLAACQAVCGIPTPSWDCDPVSGCYDPNNGFGQYTTLAACQAICVSTVSNACDSMTLVSVGAAGSPQTILMAQVPISFMDIHYWITTAPDGTVLNEDSLWNTHQIDNNNAGYDTLNICITYLDNAGFSTCCVTWVWNGSIWAKMGGVTSIGEIGLFDKKLIKVVDVLGRETSINSNQTLFFIYEDGTIEKRYIVDRK